MSFQAAMLQPVMEHPYGCQTVLTTSGTMTILSERRLTYPYRKMSGITLLLRVSAQTAPLKTPTTD